MTVLVAVGWAAATCTATVALLALFHLCKHSIKVGSFSWHSWKTQHSLGLPVKRASTVMRQTDVLSVMGCINAVPAETEFQSNSILLHILTPSPQQALKANRQQPVPQETADLAAH